MLNQQQLEYITLAVQATQETSTGNIRFKAHLLLQLCDALDEVAKVAKEPKGDTK